MTMIIPVDLNIGPAGNERIPITVNGINGNAYGCHGGIINSLLLDLGKTFSWGGERQDWAKALPPDTYDLLKDWYWDKFKAYHNSGDFSKIPADVLDNIFSKLVTWCHYSSYTFNCVVNYSTASRPSAACCLTSMFVEYLLKNKIGTMVLGPTMFNQSYVSRPYAMHPSMVRSAIWIPKPDSCVFKDDTAVYNMRSIPVSSYVERKWTEFLDATAKHYNDWNKWLK